MHAAVPLEPRAETRLPPAAAGSSSAIAWVLVIGLAAFTLLAIGAGQGRIVKYCFPLGAVLVGAVLYRNHDEFYVAYAWWIWLVTPLVRRLVDYDAGYDELNFVMLAPLGVTALCLLTLFRHLPKIRRRSVVGIVPILAALAYAYPLGIGNNGLVAATYGLLNWVVPVAFGFHLAIDGERYLSHLRSTRRTFTWAAFALGLYGVLQFVSPAPWDRYWMLNADISTIGQPFPLQVRVFSTLNSPTPFAIVMLAGLLVLLERRAVVHVAVGVPAYLAFLLSNVRTAWCGWLLGLGLYTMYLRPAGRARVFAMLCVFVLGIGLLTMSPLGERIERRLASFANLEDDGSLAMRQASAALVLEVIADQPLGAGLGGMGTAARRMATSETINFDNGLLNIFFSLGWIGGLLYLGGVLAFLEGLVRSFETKNDPVPRVARAVGFATFAALVSLNTLTGVSGVVFWGWIGLSISAKSWYRAAAAERQSAQPYASGTFADAHDSPAYVTRGREELGPSGSARVPEY